MVGTFGQAGAIVARSWVGIYLGRVIEYLAQVGQEGRVLAKRLARGIGKLGHRLSVTGNELHDDVQGLVRCVVCQICSNAETRRNSIREVFLDFKRPRNGEPVRKDQPLALGGDAHFLVMSDGLFTPLDGIARIVP